ncbi:MAG: RAD55 family ATPase [Pyrobaculum sp.]
MDLRSIFEERITFVYGKSGAGKTLFVSKIAFDFVKEGKKVVWVSFNESKDTLYAMWKSFGWRPESIAVFDYPYMPQYRETLFNQVVDLGYRERAEVFIIDGIEAIVFDRASADALTKLGFHAVVGIETHYNPLGDIADVIIKLDARYKKYAVVRKITIVKARGLEIARPIYYFAILPTGPVVVSTEPGVEYEVQQTVPPGLLSLLLPRVALGTQIAVYGPYQKISAAVVDTPNAVVYVHKPYQLEFFKKAKAILVSPFEHLKIEHYLERTLAKYIITLDAEYLTQWARRFRHNKAVWVDIYTKPPDVLGYDYVFYVDREKLRVEHSPEPLEKSELRF